MSYSLSHVIDECVDEKIKVQTKARGATPGAKYEIYEGSWVALNTWIETVIAKQKGAGIAGFGNFCWELKKKDGKFQTRPIFVISDSYIKANKIKHERVMHPPHVLAVEEVNYSMLAIKFSKNLTKDMVYSGVRDILRKIGDFIYRGYEIAVEFSIGTLYAKERKVRFDFNIRRLQEILPESITEGYFQVDESGIDYLDDSDSRRESMTARSDLSRPASSVRHPEKGMLDSKSDDHSRISNTKNNVSVPALHFDTTFNTINETKNDWEDSSARSRSTYSGPATDREINNEGVMELPDDFRTLLDTIANKAKTNNKNDFRTKASGKVMEQAYQRCLESVEEQAQLDDMLTQHNRQKQDEWKETLNQKKVNAYKQVEEIRKALDEQMQETHERLRQERLQKTTSPVKFILPDTAGVPDINPKNNRVVVAKALTQQIKANEERKKKIAEESRDRERNYLNQLALEIELNKIKERAQHLEKQKSLLEAWERDGHVRNIKKLQTMGPGAVRNYIQRNLADPMDGTYGSTGQQSLGKSLSMSIGYDPRKSKN